MGLKYEGFSKEFLDTHYNREPQAEENRKILDALKQVSVNYKLKTQAYNKEGVEVNGFVIIKDTWSWNIWKPTDIGAQPEYKGEPLIKVVPFNVHLDENRINAVLDAQPWTYV